MIATLRQRNFALLWTAGLISLAGNWMLSIALPATIYTMTGSALAVGGLILARTLPAILFGSLAGVFVDRWERRRTLIVTNVLLALSILPLLLVRSEESLWLIYVVMFVQSTLAQFFAPAENALLPLLSDPERLVSANALNALNNNFARLIGPAAGGLIAATVGLEGVVAIDALTYLVAAALCAGITVRSQPAAAQTTGQRLSVRRLYQDWLEGIRLIWRIRPVRVLYIANCFPAFSESVMSVLFVPFIVEVLRGDALDVGGLMSAQAIGGLIGGALISTVAPRVKVARLLGFSAICFGIIDLLLFNYSAFIPGVIPAYLILIVVGPFAVGMGAAYNTLLQTHVEDAYRGRIFGTFSLTEAVFSLAGIAFASFAGDRLGIVPVINVQGYAFIILGLIALFALGDTVSRRRVVAAPGD